MRLQHLKIENLIGIKRLDLALDRPICFIAGANGAGKTSIAECLRLAIFDDSPRVEHIKDYGKLIHVGAKVGTIEVLIKDCEPLLVRITDGKIAFPNGRAKFSGALEYCIKPSQFAEDTPVQRRAFLYDLMKVEISPEAIVKRLWARACDPKKVETITPILRAGFAEAQKRSAEHATLAKGAFKAVTGEAWGKVKAEAWRASLPAFGEAEAAELMGIDKALADLEAQLGNAQKRLGIAEHEAAQAIKRSETLTYLRDKAKTHAQHADLVNRTTKELENAKALLLDAQRKAGTKPPEPKTQLPCPECGALLMDSDDGESLAVWKAPESAPHDPEAAARVPELAKAVDTYSKVLSRHKANMDAAEQAAQQLKALEDTAPKKVDDPGPIRETASALRMDIAAKRQRQAELRAAHDELDRAGERTKNARAHHQAVLEWSAIAEALAPDGIPGEMLSEALGPINDRLRQSAADTDWKQVRIDPDMSITADGRPYTLLSESERWRTDAMIAEAIAQLSGLKLLVLDRFDALDLQGRSQALGWLDVLAEQGEIETALVLATLKAPLQWADDRVRSVWIERGEIVEPKLKKAAA